MSNIINDIDLIIEQNNNLQSSLLQVRKKINETKIIKTKTKSNLEEIIEKTKPNLSNNDQNEIDIERLSLLIKDWKNNLSLYDNVKNLYNELQDVKEKYYKIKTKYNNIIVKYNINE